VKIFLGILSSSILCRWPNQLILCPFIHFTIFSPSLISSSSWFVRLFHSPFSYLGPYILLKIFLSKISRACSSFFVNIHASTPYGTTGLISLNSNILRLTFYCLMADGFQHRNMSVHIHIQFHIHILLPSTVWTGAAVWSCAVCFVFSSFVLYHLFKVFTFRNNSWLEFYIFL